MAKLYNKDSGALLGEINEQQLQFLVDELEEEDSTDHDYYINRDQVDIFEENGADAQLVQMLRAALGENEDMEIRWE